MKFLISHKIHTNREKIILFPIFLLFLFACKEEKQLQPEIIAKVGDSVLFETDLQALARVYGIPLSDRKQIIEEWIDSEVYFQEAKNRGITNSSKFKVILKDSEKKLAKSILEEDYVQSKVFEITDSEIENYYNSHLDEFLYSQNVFVLTKLNFKQFETAIEFRNSVIQKNWEFAIKSYPNNVIWEKKIVAQSDLHLPQLQRTISLMEEDEISPIIDEQDSTFSIYKTEKIIPKGTQIPKENIIDEIKVRVEIMKRARSLEQLRRDIYSKYQIENYEETK